MKQRRKVNGLLLSIHHSAGALAEPRRSEFKTRIKKRLFPLVYNFPYIVKKNPILLQVILINSLAHSSGQGAKNFQEPILCTEKIVKCHDIREPAAIGVPEVFKSRNELRHSRIQPRQLVNENLLWCGIIPKFRHSDRNQHNFGAESMKLTEIPHLDNPRIDNIFLMITVES